MLKNEKVIRSADFAKRLHTACDTNPLVPPINYGRLTWLRTQLAERFDQAVSVETVRKWFSGEAKPKPDKLKLIAAVLEVDEAWLSLGLQPDMTPRERKVRNATADGAVNLIAGLVQMGGGHPAFPEPGDVRAQEGAIDLYAIIRGAQYAFHVALAAVVDDELRFTVPGVHAAAMQIGVIPNGDLAFTVVEIPEELIQQGRNKGASIEVTMTPDEVAANRINSFSKRL